MFNRKLAGIAAGALGAGALVAPLAGTATAAATSIDADLDLTCVAVYDSYKVQVSLDDTLALSVDGSAVSLAAGSVTKFINVTDPAAPKDFKDVWFGPPVGPANITFRVESVTATAGLNIDGEAVEISSTKTVEAGAGTPTTAATTFDALSGERFLTKAPASAKVTSFALDMDLRVKMATETGVGTGASMSFECEGTTSQFGDAVELISAPEGGALYKCAIPDFRSTMIVPLSVSTSAAQKGSNVAASVGLSDLVIKTIPVGLTNTPVAATMAGTVDGKAASFTGTRTVTIPSRTDIPLPTMVGAVASSAKTVDVTLGDIDIVAQHPDMVVTVDCDLAAPVTIAGVSVTPEAVKPPVVVDPPVVKGASIAKVSKVVYSKKSKKAKISVAVTGKKGTATGKATIVIKKGSKTVQKKVVSLKSGKASWTSKKISKKGTYKVTVKYAGSSKYKASKTSQAKSFKVK